MTAEHCVRDRRARPARRRRRRPVAAVRGVTFAPGWQHRNGADNVYDDIAFVTLDRPVEGVTPVTLGGAPDRPRDDPRQGPARRAGAAGPTCVLRRADLRTMTDKECQHTWGKARGNDGERFRGSTMLCAIDPDGRAPLALGLQRRQRRPALHRPRTPRRGSSASSATAACAAAPTTCRRCSPRSTATARSCSRPHRRSRRSPPGRRRSRGKARVGRTLRCRAPRFKGGATKVTIRWTYLNSSGAPTARTEEDLHGHQARPRQADQLPRRGQQQGRPGARAARLGRRPALTDSIPRVSLTQGMEHQLAERRRDLARDDRGAGLEARLRHRGRDGEARHRRAAGRLPARVAAARVRRDGRHLELGQPEARAGGRGARGGEGRDHRHRRRDRARRPRHERRRPAGDPRGQHLPAPRAARPGDRGRRPGRREAERARQRRGGGRGGRRDAGDRRARRSRRSTSPRR